MAGSSRAFWARLLSWKAWLTIIILGLVGWGVYRYFETRHTVQIEINGHHLTRYTHQTTAEGVLAETGIEILAEDRVVLPVPRDLIDGEPLVITLARPLLVVRDGIAEDPAAGNATALIIRSHASTIGDVLDELDIALGDHDRVLLNWDVVDIDTTLPVPVLGDTQSIDEIAMALRTQLYLHIAHALPIYITDSGQSRTVHTFEHTVGAALSAAGVAIYEGDLVSPDLDTPVSSNSDIRITRSKPVVLDIGGTARRIRSRADDIGGLITEQGVSMGELDYALPDMETPLIEGLVVAVIRVLDEYLVEEIPIKFEIRYEPDPVAEIDTGRIVSWGQEGARRQMVHIRYENGQQVWRQVDDEWIARQPEDRVTSYGTKIVLRELDTPQGPITYWRKLRMLATSYNAPTAGKPMDHPAYSITRLGERAAKGIIAVDPRVINMRQNMYVPGYGPGYAGDTGGAIKWRRIDLCYDDDNLILWKKWVDVYLLTPVPAEEDINWVITNYPVERE